MFYLAGPTDVGFLDAFFPTAGSREASILWRLDGELIQRCCVDGLMLLLDADGGNGLQLFGALRSDIPTQVSSCEYCRLRLALLRLRPSCIDQCYVEIVVCWGRCDR